ncbi:hypothetical protein [Leptothermofonsia sichuanensis]|nr:hypothetical protein [Leptothermofonsia sichuanensis]
MVDNKGIRYLSEAETERQQAERLAERLRQLGEDVQVCPTY